MKEPFLILIAVAICTTASAQNPYEEFGGKKYEVLTLSKGKFKEVFDEDSIVQIGTVLFNTNSNQIVAFVKKDTSNSETSLKAEISTRFLSLDPLARKYPMISPYVYVADNPIIFVDPDGRDIVDATGGKITYSRSGGQIVWSSNATADVQRIGNEMLKTATGTQIYSNMEQAAYPITLKIDNSTRMYHDNETGKDVSDPTQTTVPLFGATDVNGHMVDGKPVVSDATVTIYEKTIDAFMEVSIDPKSGQPVQNTIEVNGQLVKGREYTKDQLLGSVGVHEGTHATDPNSNNASGKKSTEQKEVNPLINQQKYLNEVKPTKSLMRK